MAFCTKCGTQIPDGAAVCPSCGQAQAGAQQTYQPQQAVPQYNAGPSLVSQVYGKPKSKLEKLLILFSDVYKRQQPHNSAQGWRLFDRRVKERKYMRNEKRKK